MEFEINQELALELIAKTCDEIKELLLKKNTDYHNSVFQPKRVHAKKLTALDLIEVRLDDKLSRMETPDDTKNIIEEAQLDYCGYNILKLILMRHLTQLKQSVNKKEKKNFKRGKSV